MAEQKIDLTHYDLLGLAPAASVQDIRRAYRELSKLYHPDTTALPTAIATAKFQALNEAYATLSSPERRSAYDLKIGYSRVRVMQSPVDLNRPVSKGRSYRSSAYLDPSDRPLSTGEIFALFILGVTFVGCLILVIAVGMTRGEFVLNLLEPSEVAETVQGDRPANGLPSMLLELTDPAPSILPAAPTVCPDVKSASAASSQSGLESSAANRDAALASPTPSST